MKKRASNGFTVIELMILLAVIGIVLASVMPMLQAWLDPSPQGQPAVSCIGGYLYTTTDRGALRQTLNEQGGGVQC